MTRLLEIKELLGRSEKRDAAWSAREPNTCPDVPEALAVLSVASEQNEPFGVSAERCSLQLPKSVEPSRESIHEPKSFLSSPLSSRATEKLNYTLSGSRIIVATDC